MLSRWLSPCFWVGEKIQSDQVSRNLTGGNPSTAKAEPVSSSRQPGLFNETLKDDGWINGWMSGWTDER